MEKKEQVMRRLVTCVAALGMAGTAFAETCVVSGNTARGCTSSGAAAGAVTVEAAAASRGQT